MTGNIISQVIKLISSKYQLYILVENVSKWNEVWENIFLESSTFVNEPGGAMLFQHSIFQTRLNYNTYSVTYWKIVVNDYKWNIFNY